MSDLPKGWASEKLNKLADRITKGSTPTSYGYQYQSEGVAFVKIENVKDGYIDKKSIRHFITDEANLNQKRSILETGDILFSIAGTIGATCLVRDSDLPANTNQALAIIRGTSVFLLPTFLRYQLESEIAQKQSDESIRGGAMSNISLENVGNFDILIPPLNEQKRIVAKLEALLSRVDASKERLEKIPKILKRFRQSVLAAACSGKLTADWRENKEINLETDLPFSWAIKPFGTLILGTPQNGLYKSQTFYGSGTPIVRIDNFYDGTIQAWNTLKRIELTAEELSTFLLEEDNILVNRVNSPKFLGKCGLVKNLSEDCVFESNMMRIKIDQKQLISEYATLFLRCIKGREELTKNAKHAVNQSSINQQDVKAVLVNLPPLPEQKEIVRRVEDLFKFADSIEERFKQAKAQVDKLTNSILAKAFRGELVPQDEADEPASVLLERIKTEKEKMQKPARSKGVSF